MGTQQGIYTLQDLEDRTGLPGRTIRSWISAGVLPKPLGRGRGAHFDEEHLTHLQFIQALREELGPRVPLKTLAEIMRGVDRQTMKRVASGEESVRAIPVHTAPPVSDSDCAPVDMLKSRTLDPDPFSFSGSVRQGQWKLPPNVGAMPTASVADESAPDLWTTIEVTADIALRLRGNEPEEVARLAQLARRLREWIEGGD
ncbi:MAG TPA: helix-turn-helix domain-containing protein [Planctomycetota bacterium]|nr:helix-turn-helix domain-containing protein [Planctomycetota bacterium]